jgi:hypothetical protein
MDGDVELVPWLVRPFHTRLDRLFGNSGAIGFISLLHTLIAVFRFKPDFLPRLLTLTMQARTRSKAYTTKELRGELLV